MRILFWFLLLAAAAVGVALATRLTSGYALFVAPPYRVELSLNLFLLLAVVGFVGGYALVRMIVRALRLPDKVRAFRRRQQQLIGAIEPRRRGLHVAGRRGRWIGLSTGSEQGDECEGRGDRGRAHQFPPEGTPIEATGIDMRLVMNLP